MKIVLSPDSFKGSLSAVQACAALARGVRRVWPRAELVCLPLADGGEGTVEALVESTAGRIQTVSVRGPLADDVPARYGILGEAASPAGPAAPAEAAGSAKTAAPSAPAEATGSVEPTAAGASVAVIEMAAAAGLPLVPPDRRDPLRTTTYGVGQLIAHALDAGCRRFLIGLGGSATHDCAAGLVQALGVRFFAAGGSLIERPMCGELLGAVETIDTTNLDPRLQETECIIACDVRNPLLGPHGAACVYAPQKGADARVVAQLEDNTRRFINRVEACLHTSVRDTPGAGAAGGMGAGLLAFLPARLESGIELVLRYSRFAQRARGADLILTGEGRIDRQTAYGKTIAGLAALAGELSIPVVALAGSLGDGADEVLAAGVRAVFSICPGPISLDEAIRRAGEFLADTAEQVCRLFWCEIHPPPKQAKPDDIKP